MFDPYIISWKWTWSNHNANSIIIRLLQIANDAVNCQFSSASRCIFSRNNSSPCLQQLSQAVYPWDKEMIEIRLQVTAVKKKK